jgi:hypothetical protein
MAATTTTTATATAATTTTTATTTMKENEDAKRCKNQTNQTSTNLFQEHFTLIHPATVATASQ